MTIHWSNACKAASPDWHVIKTPYMSAVIINLKINSTNNIKKYICCTLGRKILSSHFFQLLFNQVCQQLERLPGPLKQSITLVLKMWSPGPAASVSLGNTWEMQILQLHPSSTESETLMVRPRKLCFNKPSRWFRCKLKFENHCSNVYLGNNSSKGKLGLILLITPNTWLSALHVVGT